MGTQEARVNREVVNTLLGLALQAFENELLGELFDCPTDDHRVNRHSANRNAGSLHDGTAASVEIAARGQIHHRVGTPALRPAQLFHLLVRAGGNGGCSHVGIDLGSRAAPNARRIEDAAQVHFVSGNHQTSGCNLVADLFRSQMRLALGHASHRGSNDSKSRMLELSDRLEAFRRLRECSFSVPIRWQEVPSGLGARCRHARRVGGRKGKRAAQVARDSQMNPGWCLLDDSRGWLLHAVAK